MFGSTCCFLTCIQVSQEAGKMVWYSYFIKSIPQFVVTHTVKDFSMVNQAEVDVFLKFPCVFYDPEYIGNLISSSSAFSKPSLYIWKFSVHILLKPSLKEFEHNLAGMWNECGCILIWTFFGITSLWDWNEKTFLYVCLLLYKFWYVVFFFSFHWKYVLISNEISSLTHRIHRSILCLFPNTEEPLAIFLKLISGFVPP